ncbi:kinase-like domain-containing protein [Lentinula raphanica]|nr:kinase-like domain-containing protein [Lentinula raphanica]
MPLSNVQTHRQLEAIVSLKSDLQRALDEYDAHRRARILNPNLNREPLLWLDTTAAQRMMITLQAELDSNAGSESHRRSCFSLICYLVKRIRALPLSLLVIKDVARVGRNPVAGGGFADVWRGTMNGQAVCLKVLRLVTEQDEEARTVRFCREALVWRQLKHPHILPLLGVNLELFLPSFCLISPWMENKDIITFLRQNPKHNIFRALLDIAAGMCYLHSRDPPIVHGDIRGANVLVTDDGRCCLADFGLALVTSDVTQPWSIMSSGTSMGALRWMAPEYLESDGAAPTSVHPSRDVEFELRRQSEQEDIQRKVQNVVRQIQKKKAIGRESFGVPSHRNHRDAKKELLGGRLMRRSLPSQRKEARENQSTDRPTAQVTEDKGQQAQQSGCAGGLPVERLDTKRAAERACFDALRK